MRAYKTDIVTPNAGGLPVDINIVRANLALPEGGARDVELERSSFAALKIVESYCDRAFLEQVYMTWFFIEKVIDPVFTLTLPYYPITSPLVIRSGKPDNGRLIFNTVSWVADLDFRVNPQDGVIAVFDKFPDETVTIQYQAGLSSLPKDLEEIILQLSRDIFLRRTRESTVESESIPDQASASYFESSDLLTLPQKRVLDTYRNIWIY